MIVQEGDFEMKHIDKIGSQTFNVTIAPFSLCIIGDDNDSFWCITGNDKESQLLRVEG